VEAVLRAGLEIADGVSAPLTLPSLAGASAASAVALPASAAAAGGAASAVGAVVGGALLHAARNTAVARVSAQVERALADFIVHALD
jgi:small neutral amino acid transporter SnatA (MarC family)